MLRRRISYYMSCGTSLVERPQFAARLSALNAVSDHTIVILIREKRQMVVNHLDRHVYREVSGRGESRGQRKMIYLVTQYTIWLALYTCSTKASNRDAYRVRRLACVDKEISVIMVEFEELFEVSRQIRAAPT